VSIVDLSSVGEFALSCAAIGNLADRRPDKGDASRLCFIIAPEGLPYGLCRMFQIGGEYRRPLLQVVHTLDEAFTAIGVPSPDFGSSMCANTAIGFAYGIAVATPPLLLASARLPYSHP